METKYDVIVVGAGHAGCEAAAAAANLGGKVLIVTMDMTKTGQMSCNPAIGGIAKGQIVREIDALGGYTGLVTDKTTIQFRMLNRSKGPAMWSPRAQCDRTQFTIEWRRSLENIARLDMWQDSVVRLILSGKTVIGVETKLGVRLYGRTVVLTNGTFGNGIIHVGDRKVSGGRSGESSSHGISEQLKEAGFVVGRMKTGTPARIDGRSVNFSRMEPQHGDEFPGKFSFLPVRSRYRNQMPCYITHTNKDVHEILKTGFSKSPLFTGRIEGIGPRYCPSIEDKIVTFASKERHQLFLEPEGRFTNEYYINGFSSSLPWDIQLKALRQVEGLENVVIYRPGYAIEYDYYPPTQVNHTLETKLIKNLYLAGQINGTTGYEEAAAQGIIAGINAAHNVFQREEFVLKRDEAYIGVLIDDLVTKGVDEPYRMFTSRAEYRTLLRQDNADERLTEKAFEIGLCDDVRMRVLNKKLKGIVNLCDDIHRRSVLPGEVNQLLLEKGTSPVKQRTRLKDILLRPQIDMEDILAIAPEIFTEISKNVLFKEIKEGAEIRVKYSGYLIREKDLAEKMKRLELIRLPEDIEYEKLKNISTEGRQKLLKVKPKTIGQAARIIGVSPADIAVLIVHIGR